MVILMKCLDCHRNAKKWVQTVSRGKIIPLCGIHARSRNDYFHYEYQNEIDGVAVLEVKNRDNWIEPSYSQGSPVMVWCWIKERR